MADSYTARGPFVLAKTIQKKGAWRGEVILKEVTSDLAKSTGDAFSGLTFPAVRVRLAWQTYRARPGAERGRKTVLLVNSCCTASAAQ